MEPRSLLDERIREEIAARGPIPFDRFMKLALYAPGAGYYMRAADPFGTRGDFFTAEQLQPVFGMLVRRDVEARRLALGEPETFRVVELGPGRREMAEYLADLNYTGVDVADELPGAITGVIFANEFFDALPVRAAVRAKDGFRESLVAVEDDRYVFVEGPVAAGELHEYLERYHRDAPVGSVVEVNMPALEWMSRCAGVLERGFFVIVDYGYTSREWVRHAHGTLMSYRRHQALEDVLSQPGERDITSHVAWTPLADAARQAGFEKERFENLSSFLLRTGENGGFDAVLAAANEREEMRRRLQLKTLLFGMGETFRVLTLRK